MKRWLLWFSIPPLVFAVAVVVAWLGWVDVKGAGFLAQLAVGAWLMMTVVAVPLAIIIWLVRGRPRAPVPTP